MRFRFRLRTLLILMAVAPPVLAVVWYCYGAYRSGDVEIKVRPEAIYIFLKT